MRRAMMTALGGVLLATSFTALVVLHGCGTSSQPAAAAKRQEESTNSALLESNRALQDRQVAASGAWTPIATQQNSLGLTDSLSDARWQEFREVPQIDLNGVLQQSAGGQSPFQGGEAKQGVAQAAGSTISGFGGYIEEDGDALVEAQESSDLPPPKLENRPPRTLKPAPAPAAAEFNRDGSVNLEDLKGFVRKHPDAATPELIDILDQIEAKGGEQTPQLGGVELRWRERASGPENAVRLVLEARVTGANPNPQGPVQFRWQQARPGAAPAVTPAQFVLHPGQELWVIERTPPGQRIASRDDDMPGSGTMMTRWAEPGQAERMVPVPLQHTDVRASIAGPISSVQVTQKFANPYSSKIEAVYVFPLPDDAAVNDFVMTIGTRSIRGVIREREQAEQIYQQAKSQGYHASLMTQERSNIFTQRVANIEPSEKIDVSITYFNTLAFRDGAYEFVFPMVVGPRFNPPSPPSTLRGERRGEGAGVGAVPVNANGASGQATEVSYVRPSERCGTDIALSVDLDAGVAVESISSPSHQVNITPEAGSSGRARIELSGYDSIPNRDFVLRYRVAGGQAKAGMLTFDDGKDGKGGFFSMVIVPPEDLKYTRRGPVELVLVIDCSGSMDGEPLALAKKSAVNMLRQLRAEDSFQVIRFSDSASFMTRQTIGADARNVDDGVRYVEGLRAEGGTLMLNGLEPALAAKGEDWGWAKTRYVCVLSDGLLGNEPEVLGQLSKKLGDSRIFTLGIGSAPNRTLMNAMSRLGRGAAGYVANDRDAVEVTDLFVQRIANAAMTDLRFDWGGMDVVDVYPKRIPDLYIGRPVVITGRYRGWDKGSGQVRISGRVGSDRQEMSVTAQPGTSNPNARGLPLVWARTRITELDEQTSWGAKPGAGSENGPNQGEIKDLALRYGLLSAYTSFVAVDSLGRTGGNYGTSVSVPVNMPAGTRYDTTVGER